MPTVLYSRRQRPDFNTKPNPNKTIDDNTAGNFRKAEHSAVKRIGEKFPIELSVSYLSTTEGIITICAIRDITQRKKVEEELRISENKFHSLVHNISDIILLFYLFTTTRLPPPTTTTTRFTRVSMQVYDSVCKSSSQRTTTTTTTTTTTITNTTISII